LTAVILRNKQRIALYGNNNRQIGAGHIMRLFALAQSAEREFEVTFIYKECTRTLLKKFQESGYHTAQIESSALKSVTLTSDFDVVVVDDYDLTDAEWNGLKESGAYLVKLDDALDEMPIVSDLVVNPALDVTEARYRQLTPDAHLCLGPSFTYLRKEFARQTNIPIEDRSKILISLGGTDPHNLSSAILLCLAQAIRDAEVAVLISNDHPQERTIRSVASNHRNTHIYCNPPSVAKIMAESGLAISAAGGTLGELASLGVPTIALVTTNNHKAALYQQHNENWYIPMDIRPFTGMKLTDSVRRYIAEKITESAQDLWTNISLRQKMSADARRLVDTRGCDRIIEHIKASQSAKPS